MFNCISKKKFEWLDWKFFITENVTKLYIFVRIETHIIGVMVKQCQIELGSVCCCAGDLAEEGDDLRTTGEMRWGEGWDEVDVDPLEAQEEVANSGNERKEGKESKSLCTGGRSLICGCTTWRSATHILPGQVYGMCAAAKDMGHRVVGGTAIGAGGVIGPAYGVAVRLDPRAVAGTELGEGTTVGPGQQLFSWVNWKGSGHGISTLLGAWNRTISSIIQPRMRRLAKG